MSGFTYYWCDICEFDTVRSKPDIKGSCPVCAEDNGREGRMLSKPCPDDCGQVEGKDDRMEGRKDG